MDSQYGQLYEKLYRGHWWWQSREAMLLDVIRSLGLPPAAKILDVGCGNGLFFDKLGQFGDVCGIEVDRSLIPADSPYRDRIFGELLGHDRYRNLRFDLITALDVVEHIEDDRKAIGDMLTMLRPGGKLIVTVPASMMLWDAHDEINRHWRRYSRKTLRALLAGQGRILRLQYLFHVLFPPKLAVKLLNKCRRRRVAQHGIPPKAVNWLAKTVCVCEYRALGWLRLPFGTSLLAVVEKPAE
jgi:2-polyprenyl-3-methyl-5-hydroxy-6-metoxy-1,4-benzoquinol methylase